MRIYQRGMPVIALSMIIVLLLAGVWFMNNRISDNSSENDVRENYQEPDYLVREDKSVYDDDPDGQVDYVYVHVLPPEGDYVTLEDINANPNYNVGSYDAEANDLKALVLVTIDGMTRKGTIELRGQSSRLADQKSYKIKFFEDEIPFHGMMTLNLNKHYKDLSRVRNKLAFDIIEDIDNMIGLRTRFIRLDISTLDGNHDYGLYTLIEQPNRSYLSSHGLDKNGQLYKAEYFEFLRYAGDIESKDAVNYSDEKFNQHLEVRENEDHDKLVKLLEAVNDPKRNINDVVDEYFDKDNILTWVAFNILLDNYDSNSRNYMLYSPSYSEKWYFVSWDLDKTLRDKEDAYWTFGVSNYWGVEIFQRLFRDPENMNLLVLKIEELYPYFMETSLLSRLKIYEDVVREHMLGSVDLSYYESDIFASRSRHPDINNEDDYFRKLYELGEIPSKNRQRFYENLERPYPYFIQVKEADGIFEFTWDLAFDVQGDKVTYEIVLYEDLVSNKVLMTASTDDLSYRMSTIPNDAKYFTVIAKDSKGYEQVPFNRISVDGNVYIGVERIFDE